MSDMLVKRAALPTNPTIPSEIDRYGRNSGAAGEVIHCDSGLSQTDTFHSARSYEIATERGGGKLMSEEEVSNLVHCALRKARKATGGAVNHGRQIRAMSVSPRVFHLPSSPTKQTMRKPFSFDNDYPNETLIQSRQVDVSNRYHTGSSFGDNSDQYEVVGPSIEKHVSNLSLEDSSDSGYASQMERQSDSRSVESSVGLHTDSSGNSSDTIIRRVEEEIANARRAAYEANRRLASAMNNLETTIVRGAPEVVRSNLEKDQFLSSSKYSNERSVRGDSSNKVTLLPGNASDAVLIQSHKFVTRSVDPVDYLSHDTRNHNATCEIKQNLPPDDRDEESVCDRSTEMRPGVMTLTSPGIEQHSWLETPDSSMRAEALLNEVLRGSMDDVYEVPSLGIEQSAEFSGEPSTENHQHHSAITLPSESLGQGSMDNEFDSSLDKAGRPGCVSFRSNYDDPSFIERQNQWEAKPETFRPQLSAHGNIIMRLLATTDQERKAEPTVTNQGYPSEEVIDLTQVGSDQSSGSREGAEVLRVFSQHEFATSSDEDPSDYLTAPEVSESDEDEQKHESEQTTKDSSPTICQDREPSLMSSESLAQIDGGEWDNHLSASGSGSRQSIDEDFLEFWKAAHDTHSSPTVDEHPTVPDEHEYKSTEADEVEFEEQGATNQIVKEEDDGDYSIVADQGKTGVSESEEESHEHDEDVLDGIDSTLSKEGGGFPFPPSTDEVVNQEHAMPHHDDSGTAVDSSVSLISSAGTDSFGTDNNIVDIILPAVAGEPRVDEHFVAGATLAFLDEQRPEEIESEDDAITAVAGNDKPKPILNSQNDDVDKFFDKAEAEVDSRAGRNGSLKKWDGDKTEKEEATKPPHIRSTTRSWKEEKVSTLQSRRVRFKQRYPVPPLSKKSRPPEDIVKDHIVPHTVNTPFLSKPKPDLLQLLAAAVGTSIQRRSNAIGALKVLTMHKKNQLMLVRTAGFLDALVFAATADIPRKAIEPAIDARCRAVMAICNVSEPKDNREVVFCHPGLILALIQTIVEDKAEARLAACGALAMLAKTSSNREPMTMTQGLINALVMIVTGSSRLEPVLSKTQSNSFSSEGDSDHDSSCRRSYSTHSESTSSSVEHSSSGSHDEYEVVLPMRQARSLRQQKQAKRHQTTMQSQTYACATLLHLSKQCGATAIMGQSDALLRALVKVSRQPNDPMRTKCIEILCNLSRFPANIEKMAKFPGLIDSLVMNGGSSDMLHRVWSLRVLQNLSSLVAGKTVLANRVVLELLSFSVMRETLEEQLAATATIYNLSTEPGAVVPLTNSKNVVATLVHVAHNPESTSEVRLMACDALATLGLWLQTLAGAGTLPDEVDPNTTLPSYGTSGWNRWE